VRPLVPTRFPVAIFWEAKAKLSISYKRKIRIHTHQFNKKMIHHLLCPDCGIESFARGRAPEGKEMVAINVRCLEGVDVKSLPLTPIDGRNM